MPRSRLDDVAQLERLIERVDSQALHHTTPDGVRRSKSIGEVVIDWRDAELLKRLLGDLRETVK